MGSTRIFVPQQALDEWMSVGRVTVEGESMTVVPDGSVEGQVFHLKTALHFETEVAGGGDEPELVGKVKDLDQVQSLGGEHYADSVILGDNAYQVVEGFVAQPVPPFVPELAAPEKLLTPDG